MEVQYTFAILNTFIVLVYVYTMWAFNFGDRGVKYLQTLLNDEPETLNNDPKVLRILKDRDLRNMQLFVGQRERVKGIMAVAVVINFINYTFYPYDSLLYPWMSYILVIASVIVNLDILITLLGMYNNKHHVSTICNVYYKMTLAHKEQNKKIDETVALIEQSFVEMMNDLDGTKFIEGDKKDGTDEE